MKKLKKEYAKKGGEAPHEKRGLQAADEETRQRVASEGGKASHKNDKERITIYKSQHFFTFKDIKSQTQ